MINVLQCIGSEVKSRVCGDCERVFTHKLIVKDKWKQVYTWIVLHLMTACAGPELITGPAVCNSLSAHDTLCIWNADTD